MSLHQERLQLLWIFFMTTVSVADVTMNWCHVLTSFEDNDLELFVHKAMYRTIILHYNFVLEVSHLSRFLFKYYLLVERSTQRLGGSLVLETTIRIMGHATHILAILYNLKLNQARTEVSRTVAPKQILKK